jgi:hypothetical protein
MKFFRSEKGVIIGLLTAKNVALEKSRQAPCVVNRELTISGCIADKAFRKAKEASCS